MAKTLYEKLFDAHVVYEAENETPLLYIDRHLVHEVTSPQAFDGLRAHGRPVRQPGKTFATMDHNVSTQTKDINACGEMARIQMQELIKNCKEFGVELYDLNHPYQGIVHVMGPEQGVTLPGMTIVCGDSHTATHGAFGALAFGIGTSEVEHVLATQTLKQGRAKTMKIEVQGKAAPGITAKDIVLAIIGKTGSAGGTGHVVEFCGEAIRDLSMEGRMTLCNMAIEMGAKAVWLHRTKPPLTMLKAVCMRRKAKISTTPLPTGKPCKPTKEQLSIPLSLCKQKRFRRRSPGAPIEPGDFCERQYSRSGFVCRSG